MSDKAWSTRAEVVAALRRRWGRGEFLIQFAEGREWEPFGVALRGPTARDVADRFGEVQSWVQRWREIDRRLLRIETRPVGGRVVGSNELPAKAWIDSYHQLWSLLGVASDVRCFSELLEETKDRAPRLAEWMAGKPLEALRHADEWGRLVDTVLWIESSARRDMYIRQVDVPGVDTKFIERHRKILAALLDRQLPEHRIDRNRPPADFAGRYGFLTKPEYVRFRFLGHHVSGFTEMSVRVDELAARPLEERTVFVVENEVTYLAFPPVAEAVAIFGGGYSVSGLESLPWLVEKELVYWGDIDTHGFAILSGLRRRFGHVRSMLMDRATLLAHEAHWGSEAAPVNAHLESLTAAETALYTDLVENTLGESIRLEQERIRFSAVERALLLPR